MRGRRRRLAIRLKLSFSLIQQKLFVEIYKKILKKINTVFSNKAKIVANIAQKIETQNGDFFVRRAKLEDLLENILRKRI